MTDDRQHQEAAHSTAPVSDGVRCSVDHDPLPVGARLVTPRRGYTHHGIYVGAGRVVHYEGLSWGLHRGPVKEVSLEEFADGCPVTIKPVAHVRYSGAQVAARARSRLGEDRYRLITNNCEHFCEWCIRGEARSEQVERAYAWPRRALLFFYGLLGRSFFNTRLDNGSAATGSA